MRRWPKNPGTGISIPEVMRVPGYRKKTVIAAAAAVLLVICAALWVAARHSRPLPSMRESLLGPAPAVMLDAGHGGLDGGAVSRAGLAEAGVNLAIADKARGVLMLLGVPATMTRETADSLNYDAEASIRANKNADLTARLALAEQYPDALFLSVHLNNFSQSAYHGAQVFYAEKRPESAPLAQSLQRRLRAVLDPTNTRAAKPAPERVYLMTNAPGPAVTIECGFLSNPAEAERLAQDDYQTWVALAIAAGATDYLISAP
jgi:N-acetylmuramoyl-L-alanine amidase